MFNVSAILQQATEILGSKAEEALPETFDAAQFLDGAGLDAGALSGLPLDDPGAIFSELGIEEALPVDPAILAAASDVFGGRSEAG